MSTTRAMEDIIKDMDKMANMRCKPEFSKVKENHIFDEDKSVRWNREQVVINNKLYDDEVKRLNTEKNKVRDKLTNEIYDAIVEYVGKKHINREKATKIWGYAYDKGHSYGYNEVLTYLYEIADLICDMFE